MINTDINPMIGEIYLMRFSGTNHEQAGWRPGLVFQNNVGNAHSPNIIAVPLTTALKKQRMPTHVVLSAVETGLIKDSMVLCEGPERMSKEHVGTYITTLGKEDMAKVARAYLLATSVITFLGLEEITAIWYDAIKLNNAQIIV